MIRASGRWLRRSPRSAPGALAILAALLMIASPVNAQAQAPEVVLDSVQEEQARALASELRCPVCQGMSIEDSPTELAVQMKNIIREQLAAGRSPDEVRQYFVDRYGQWVLLKPEASGFNLIVYVLPWAVLLGGGAVIVVGVRRWTRSAGGDDQPAASTPSGQ
ncbi:MAG TPA: cytochrome c-type biogenesis protein [Longimicrobiales bacterium]|nr:cytochrome c-type biogenesis protein [Longimicrobiales bacterium]